MTRSVPVFNKHGKFLGKRKGLEISNGERLYVTAIGPEKNAIVVGLKEDL